MAEDKNLLNDLVMRYLRARVSSGEKFVNGISNVIKMPMYDDPEIARSTALSNVFGKVEGEYIDKLTGGNTPSFEATTPFEQLNSKSTYVPPMSSPIEAPKFANAKSPELDMSSLTGILPQENVSKAQAEDTDWMKILESKNYSPVDNETAARAAGTVAPTVNVGERESFKGVRPSYNPAGVSLDNSPEVNPYDIPVPERGKPSSGKTFGAGMLGVLGDAIAHGVDKNYNQRFDTKGYVDYVNSLSDQEYNDALKKLGIQVEKGKWDTSRKDTKFDQALKKASLDADIAYKRDAIEISKGKASGIGNTTALKIQAAQQEDAQVIRNAITRWSLANDVPLRDAIGIYDSVTKGYTPTDPRNADLVKKYGKSLFNDVLGLSTTMKLRRPVTGADSDSWLNSDAIDSALINTDKSDFID